MLIGTVVTGIVGGGAWLYSKRKKNKDHEEECKKIEQTLDNEVKLSEKENADIDCEKISDN